MIVHLRGSILSSGDHHVVIETAGVGYRVEVTRRTAETLAASEGEVALHIHSHYTETDHRLYGFTETRERLLFELLITVKGVGPRLGVMILSGLDSDSLSRAIRSEDIARLSSISGIGRKTAERIALELKEKIKDDAVAPMPGAGLQGTAGRASSDRTADAVQALESLGYRRKDAETVVAAALKEHPESDTGALIRSALSALKRG